MSSVHGANFEADLPGDTAPSEEGAIPVRRTARSKPAAFQSLTGATGGVAEVGETAPAGAPETALGMSPEMSLLRQAQSGDRSAYGRLVISCQDRLYNAMLRLSGNAEEARDLTQEAFTRGLAKIETYRGDAAPYTWLFRIAANLAIGQLRRGRRHRTFSLDGSSQSGRAAERYGGSAAGFAGRGTESAPRGGNHDAAENGSPLRDRLAQDADGSGQPPEIIEQRERQQQVLSALGRIDPESRAILVMRDVEGFDYQQMAEVLGLPLGTLKSRLFRAPRLALRDELKSYMQPSTPPGKQKKP